jgi:predicted permease
MFMQLLERLRYDVTYAARTLRREPGVAVGIIATFALAIGANAAMFGLVGKLLMAAPPGVRDPQTTARVLLQLDFGDGERFNAITTSYPTFRALGGAQKAFTTVAAIRRDTLTIGRGAELSEVSAIAASGDYFNVLGARPLRGRFFTSADDELPAGNPVVVLSHRFWQRQFGGDTRVLGSPIDLDGDLYTIIGVAESEFTGDRTAPVDVFIPLTASFRKQSPSWVSDSRLNLVEVIARLRTGVSIPVAQQSAANAVRAMMILEPDARSLAGIQLDPLLPARANRDTPQGKTTIWLTGVAIVVLLIATANVGTLLLLRALRRRREIAVRIALGAGRGRLATQLLTESLLLALTGSAIGLVVSRWLAELIRKTLLPGVAPSEGIVDPGILAATIAMASAAGIVAGCIPLVQAGRRDLVSALKAGDERGTSSRAPLRAVLVGLQVALCSVLLVGAGLFQRSLQRVQSQDLGFSTSRLLYVTLDFRVNMPGRQRDELHRDASRRLTTLPGVTSASIAQATPFGNFHVPPISVPGLPEPPMVGRQLPYLYAATPDYLRMMNVKLLEGRLLTERDGRNSPLVVLVNETFARTVWPGGSAVGKCVRAGHVPDEVPSPVASPTLPCREIVGVVRDSRARSIRPDGNEAKFMQYYVPFDQVPSPPVPNVSQVSSIIVQANGDPDRLIGPVQRLLQTTLGVPVYARVRPYQDLLDPQIRPWRLGATLFSAFALLAVGIATVGLFGVISYLASQRTREIGVRLALGGSRAHVERVVVVDGVRMVAAGIVAGALIAFAAGPFVQPLLFQTSARDVTIMVAAGVLLLLVAVVAAALPAWRAARVSPLVALRVE